MHCRPLLSFSTMFQIYGSQHPPNPQHHNPKSPAAIAKPEVIALPAIAVAVAVAALEKKKSKLQLQKKLLHLRLLLRPPCLQHHLLHLRLLRPRLLE